MGTHVMLDIETMSTSSYAAIVSIGAVKFDPYGAEVTAETADSFFVRVDLASAMKAGLRAEAHTILWWLRQSDDARSATFNEGASAQLDEALLGFSDWFGPNDRLPVWGNGATFDNVIVSNAYAATGLERPWHYSADRCFRTINSLAHGVPRPEGRGVAHHALDDALTQARWLQRICRDGAVLGL